MSAGGGIVGGVNTTVANMDSRELYQWQQHELHQHQQHQQQLEQQQYQQEQQQYQQEQEKQQLVLALQLGLRLQDGQMQ